MHKKLAFVLILSMLLFFFPYLRFSLVGVVNATNGYSVHNIDTGLNYTSIQAAIDAPETFNGHTIKVDSGIHYEHVALTKSITLVGEDRDNTVVDGNGTGTLIQIIADDVNIINFTVRNAGRMWGPPPGHGYPDSCIFGSNVARIIIENNVFEGAAASVAFSDDSSFVKIGDNLVSNSTYIGILVYASHNFTICHNFVYDYGSEGIHLDGGCYYCKILNNTVKNGYDGISLEKSATANNLIDGNYLTANNLAGIGFFRCGANVFRRNNITGCTHNLLIWGYDLTNFMQDIDRSNTADNKVLYYLTNRRDLLIEPSNYSDLGDIFLVNCTDIMIRDFNLTGNRDGVLLAGSTNCTLMNITLGDNREPIIYGGFPLLYGGLTFFESNENTIVNSRICNNSYGVCLYYSDRNVFCHNSFVNIDRYVVSDFYSIFQNISSGYFSVCTWDDGIEGNHWSNYDGVDSDHDGIGDAQYEIDFSNIDHFPLMGVFWSFNISLDYHVNIISNSTINDFQYFKSNSTIRMRVSNMTGDQTFGFCRICIPHALMTEPYYVTIDGAEPYYVNYTVYDNETHRWIYFSYQHSKREIIIVPEFASFLITPLFMMATLLAVIIHKRKQAPI